VAANDERGEVKIELRKLRHDWWEIKNPFCTWQRKGTREDLEAYVLKLAPRFAEPTNVKICRTCREEKPKAEFAAKGSGQPSSKCKDCEKINKKLDQEKRRRQI
jgi:hypothetical protein